MGVRRFDRSEGFSDLQVDRWEREGGNECGRPDKTPHKEAFLRFCVKEIDTENKFVASFRPNFCPVADYFEF